MIQYFTYDTVLSVIDTVFSTVRKNCIRYFSRYFYVFCYYDTVDTNDTV